MAVNATSHVFLYKPVIIMFPEVLMFIFYLKCKLYFICTVSVFTVNVLIPEKVVSLYLMYVK